MTYTSVVLSLSSGLAKNNKIMSMFVLFCRLFWLFRKFGFFPKQGEKPYTKAVNRIFLVNFLKV